MNKSHLFILNGNDTCMSCLLLSLRLSIARSNPSQSTSSHAKKNPSSWPKKQKIRRRNTRLLKIMHIRDQRNSNNFLGYKKIWHNNLDTQAYQQVTMSFKISMLKNVIPRKSYSLIMLRLLNTKYLSCTTPMTSQEIVSYF